MKLLGHNKKVPHISETLFDLTLDRHSHRSKAHTISHHRRAAMNKKIVVNVSDSGEDEGKKLPEFRFSITVNSGKSKEEVISEILSVLGRQNHNVRINDRDKLPDYLTRTFLIAKAVDKLDVNSIVKEKIFDKAIDVYLASGLKCY